MAKPFDNWGASLLDSVKIFDLIAERRATFGTERVLSMVCQEYVNAFGGENYKNRKPSRFTGYKCLCSPFRDVRVFDEIAVGQPGTGDICYAVSFVSKSFR